jgi:RES domain-containing protein
MLPLVLAAALAAGACTAASEPQTAAASREGRQCFRAQDVNGFTARNEREVDVTVGANNVYRLELMGRCPDVDWSQTIAIEARGSSWICSGLDAELIVPTAIGPQRCPVTAIRRIPDEQLRAEREAARQR